MALAERSKADVERLVRNTAEYSRTVEARNAVPLLQGDALKAMIDAASKIDLSKVGSSTAES